MFILTLMDGTNYVLTQEQKNLVSQAMDKSDTKNIYIFNATIPIHQITGIRDFELYKQQMKTSLQSKGKKMCRRCGTIVATGERCPCVEKPEKFPDILDLARSYNPELAKQLDAIAEQKQLSPPSNEEN